MRSHHGAAYKGLQLELQYRTIYQHAWATCVEVVGLVTTNNPKFKEGDQRYEDIMVYASELIARVWEQRCGPLPDLSDRELVKRFTELDDELGFMDMLRELKANDAVFKGRNHNVILIFADDGPLEIRTYRDATSAIEAYWAHYGSPALAGLDHHLNSVREGASRSKQDQIMSDTPDKILRLNTVLDRTGLSRSTLYRKVEAGTFPKQVQISQRCVGWRESAIQEWLGNPIFYSADNGSSAGGPR